MAKPKLAIYWAAACGGCDIAILDTQTKLLEIADFFDVVFWPVAFDFKYDDVRKMPDKSITLTLFNGAVRNSENLEIAQLLRAKSVLMCAFGSCAADGGIPALANLCTKESILEYVYKQSPSLAEPSGARPEETVKVSEGEVHIPIMWNTVRSLDQVVEVDYVIPGCPPQSDQIAAVVDTVVNIMQHDGPLPPKGTVLGAGEKSCCEECPRERNIKKIKRFVRPFAVDVDPKLCLLEQGIVCMGPATRSGCGAKCPNAGVPCRGCYALPSNVRDQGAKMASAVASIIDSKDPDEIAQIIATIPDPAGTFYRFSMANSMLRRANV